MMMMMMMRREKRRLRTLVVAAVIGLTSSVAIAGLIGPRAAQADHAGAARAGEQPAADVANVDAQWWRGTDFIVTGRGDTDGITCQSGWEREKYAFRPLATIQPAGYDGDAWLGYQCVTGDRRHVMVTVLPRWAVNRPERRARGAPAYVVNVATGRVRPAAKGGRVQLPRPWRLRFRR
jgi:hypothetical protein